MTKNDQSLFCLSSSAWYRGAFYERYSVTTEYDRCRPNNDGKVYPAVGLVVQLGGNSAHRKLNKILGIKKMNLELT